MGTIIDRLDRGVVALSVWNEWASAEPDFGDNHRLRAAHSWTVAAAGAASFLSGLFLLDRTDQLAISPTQIFIIAGLISSEPAMKGANLVWRIAMRHRPVPPKSSLHNAL